MEQSASVPRLSVVVPCFNEADVLPEFVERMVAACRASAGDDFEIIIIDDGSSDATFALAHGMTDCFNLVAVKLARNYGHQVAATTGLALAKGEWVLLIDADLQDPPELLPPMLALMDGGADVVFGQRVRREGETVFKRLTAHLFYRVLSKLSDCPIPPDVGDFRLMSRRIVDILCMMPEQQRFLRGMVSLAGGRQVPLPYVREARRAGRTKYSLGKMIGFAADALTGFSTKPLRLAIHLSWLTGLFAISLLLYSFVRWWGDETIPGWTSQMMVVALFGSLQFLMLGILGEYVGRIFVEVKRRPLFLIDEVSINGARFRPSPVDVLERIGRRALDGIGRGTAPEQRR